MVAAQRMTFDDPPAWRDDRYRIAMARVEWRLAPRSRTVRIGLPDDSLHLVCPVGTFEGSGLLPGYSVALVKRSP
jgi:hypothetical protein